jgi:broad specificity phosphatase PhoE
VRVFLVRHAKAQKRPDWRGPDVHRPLTAGGRRQAFGFAKSLDGTRVRRIVSSPALRCRQTVAPLAFETGVPLEVDARLFEGKGAEGALALLQKLPDGTAVLSSHGDVIPELLGRLEAAGVDVDDKLRCAKGSAWLLEGPGRDIARATYLPPVEEPRLGDFPLRGDEVRVGVLDLGSTSFHLLVADVPPDGQLRRVTREREMLRLGTVLARGPRIPDDVRALALESARRLRAVAEEAQVELFLPVATAALREASNGREVARALGEALGEPVRMLEGREEARLIFGAFRRRLSLPKGNALGVDLGGGSLELAVGDRAGVHFETTLRLGVARLYTELVTSDPLDTAERKAIQSRVSEGVGPIAARIRRLDPQLAVAAGGTIGALARRLLVRRGGSRDQSIQGLEIPARELAELADELARGNHEERLRTPGIDERRADLLPTGALILAALVEILGLASLTVSDWGLRESVILEALGQI